MSNEFFLVLEKFRQRSIKNAERRRARILNPPVDARGMKEIKTCPKCGEIKEFYCGSIRCIACRKTWQNEYDRTPARQARKKTAEYRGYRRLYEFMDSRRTNSLRQMRYAAKRQRELQAKGLWEEPTLGDTSIFFTDLADLEAGAR
jgi:ribosomal protein L32